MSHYGGIRGYYGSSALALLR